MKYLSERFSLMVYGLVVLLVSASIYIIGMHVAGWLDIFDKDGFASSLALAPIALYFYVNRFEGDRPKGIDSVALIEFYIVFLACGAFYWVFIYTLMLLPFKVIAAMLGWQASFEPMFLLLIVPICYRAVLKRIKSTLKIGQV